MLSHGAKRVPLLHGVGAIVIHGRLVQVHDALREVAEVCRVSTAMHMPLQFTRHQTVVDAAAGVTHQQAAGEWETQHVWATIQSAQLTVRLIRDCVGVCRPSQ